MKNLVGLLFLFIQLFSINGLLKAQQGVSFYSPRLVKIWETNAEFFTAESVCYDTAAKCLYISCINGSPTEKDQNGFISKLDLDGNTLEYRWVKKLSAPKGMAVYKGKLFVTDIDRIVEIETSNGRIIAEYPVSGAKFLNDVAIDDAGNVYFTDSSTGFIHRLSGGKVITLNPDKILDSPNGLYCSKGYLKIGTRTDISEMILNSRNIMTFVSRIGPVDGLAYDGKKNYLVSDWTGKIRSVGATTPELLLDTSPAGINAADFEYIPALRLLIVPTFSTNTVAAYKLKD